LSVDLSLIDGISEVLEQMGVVAKRHMMGDATLYLDGVAFSIVAQDDLGSKQH
jgi:TfoX/Sxy family transcriptional regulator of competence genes